MAIPYKNQTASIACLEELAKDISEALGRVMVVVDRLNGMDDDDIGAMPDLEEFVGPLSSALNLLTEVAGNIERLPRPQRNEGAA